MTAAMRAKSRWDTRQYRRIVSARCESDHLIVGFEDGDVATVPVVDLLSPRDRTPRWEELRSDHYEIVVPTTDDAIEIPWSTIRVMTDPEYDAHLAAAAVVQRRRIGQRVQHLRQRQGLSAADLAQWAGLSEEHLARIEAGDDAITFPPVQRLLEAMDHSLDDLIVAPGTRSTDERAG